ncbi:MAG: hypothetical protein U1E52_17440 [Geminicoccaceae bacterium]
MAAVGFMPLAGSSKSQTDRGWKSFSGEIPQIASEIYWRNELQIAIDGLS